MKIQTSTSLSYFVGELSPTSHCRCLLSLPGSRCHNTISIAGLRLAGRCSGSFWDDWPGLHMVCASLGIRQCSPFCSVREESNDVNSGASLQLLRPSFEQSKQKRMSSPLYRLSYDEHLTPFAALKRFPRSLPSPRVMTLLLTCGSPVLDL